LLLDVGEEKVALIGERGSLSGHADLRSFAAWLTPSCTLKPVIF